MVRQNGQLPSKRPVPVAAAISTLLILILVPSFSSARMRPHTGAATEGLEFDRWSAPVRNYLPPQGMMGTVEIEF